MSLLPEEVVLLVSKNIAKVVHYPSLQDAPSEIAVEESQELLQDLLEEQKVIYKEIRKRDLEKVIDKVIAGKKRKNSGNIVGTREEILEEELNKSSNVTEDNMLTPIFTSPLDSCKGKMSVIYSTF